MAISDTLAEVLLPQHFFSSPDSQFCKLYRTMLRAALLGTLGAGLLSLVLHQFPILFLGLVFLVVFGGMALWLRMRLNTGKTVLTVDAAGICSALLPGKNKSLAWRDLTSVTFVQLNQVPSLNFQRSQGRPLALPLNVFNEATQQDICAVVQRALATTAQSQAVFVDEVAATKVFQERLKAFGTPWLVYVLIAVNVVVWLFTLTWGGGFNTTDAALLFQWGGNSTSEVQKGEWWRLLSATFLHSGFIHLVLNMVGLYTAGVVVERIYGARQFALIYLGSALLGSALSLHFSAQQAVSVGASGAVFGVTGALWVAMRQNRSKLPQAFGKQMVTNLGFFIVYSLFQGFTHAGIDNAAHVGGLVGGAALAYMLPERFDLERFMSTFRERTVFCSLTALLVVAGVAYGAPKAAVDQASFIANQRELMEALVEHAAAMKSFKSDTDAVQQGRLDEAEVKVRFQQVYIPMVRKLKARLDSVEFPKDSSQQRVLQATRQLDDLLLELMQLDEADVAAKDRQEAIRKEAQALVAVINAEAATRKKRGM